MLPGAFGLFGLFWGTFAVLLADLSRALDLTPGPLGLAFFIGAAASILAMSTLGWTADRLGRRMFLLLTGGVMGLGISGLAFADGYISLVGVMIVLYASSGLYDVGINAAAVDLEQSTGRRFMTVLHATFSFGGVVGALSAGALLQTGVEYRLIYLGVLLPLAAVMLAVRPHVSPGPAPQSGARRSRLADSTATRRSSWSPP